MNADIMEIPNYPNLRLCKDKSVVILDDDYCGSRIITSDLMKFRYHGETLYIQELANIVYYGLRDPMKFKDAPYQIINDTDIELFDIVFRKIKDFLDGYYISSDGIVYSSKRHMLRRRNIDDDGYVRISFSHKGMTNIGIHRLVYSTWIGPIPDGHVIDHRNNRKWDNSYTNLVPITAMENSRKAANDGMYRSDFHWDEDMVRYVCEMMRNDVSIKDIAASLGISPSDRKLYKNFRNQLYSFRQPNPRAWKDIVTQYDLSSYSGNVRPDSRYRDCDIVYMRELYAAGYTIPEIAQIFDTHTSAYLSKLIRGIKRKNIRY